MRAWPAAAASLTVGGVLLALGLALLAGALIVRWERRHHTRVLRTGGFFRPDRLILAQ